MDVRSEFISIRQRYREMEILLLQRLVRCRLPVTLCASEQRISNKSLGENKNQLEQIMSLTFIDQMFFFLNIFDLVIVLNMHNRSLCALSLSLSLE